MKRTIRVVLFLLYVSISTRAGLAQYGIISTYAGAHFPLDGTIATVESIIDPVAVVGDGAGGFYISIQANQVFRVTSDGVLHIVAGNGASGFSGDGGPATSALLNSPRGLAVDAAGILYIADTGNNRIRKVSVDGVIRTVAGNGVVLSNGVSGFGGDGGPATSAQVNQPEGVAVDVAGNLYIADTGNDRTRKVTPDGVIRTVAGNGIYGFSGDGGPATSASFSTSEGVAVDAAGNLYIADRFNARIRKVTPDGVISTFAGHGLLGVSAGFSGDGGPATSASLNFPNGVAVDAVGNVYICDALNNRIRKVTPEGVISTVVGNGATVFTGDGGSATSASLNFPNGVAVDAAGNLYIADKDHNRIRKVIPGGVISTAAGNGTLGFSGEGGPAISALLNSPRGVAEDAAGNLYIADAFNYRIRKVTPGGVISTVAGNGVPGFSGDGGPATSASLSAPDGVAVDAAGNIYIADAGNERVRKVTLDGTISTVAGNGGNSFPTPVDGVPATSTPLNSPFGVAVDGAGNLYIVDNVHNRIRKVVPGGTISTVAGNGTRGFSGDGGQASSASLAGPLGVAVDAIGNLYISDTDNARIRKVTPGGVISTVAGNGAHGYGGDDGLATSASLNRPNGVAVDAAGNLYIADANNRRVRKVTPDGVIRTVAGNGTFGLSGDGGPALSAQLENPMGVAVDNAGRLYIADETGANIRKVDLRFDLPTIANITPNSGAMGRVVNVTLSGTNFVSPVDLNAISGITVSNLAVVGPTSLTATFTISASAAGARAVTVANSTGSSNAVAFSVNLHSVRRDFNGDGKSDVLWRDTAGNVSMWLVNGYTVTNSLIANIWTGWTIVGTGDFDGDGSSDILWRDTSGNVAMWLMTGTTVATSSVIGNIWLGWSIAGTGDFDGDGRSDILWRDTSGNVAMWLMNGTAVIRYGSIGNLPMTSTVAAVADFDADGRVDILWRGASGDVTLWTMNGFTIKTNMFIANIWTGWTIIGSGDFSGDGKADILWRDTSGNVAIWMMDGSTVSSYNGIANDSDRMTQ